MTTALNISAQGVPLILPGFFTEVMQDHEERRHRECVRQLGFTDDRVVAHARWPSAIIALEPLDLRSQPVGVLAGWDAGESVRLARDDGDILNVGVEIGGSPGREV